MYAPRSFRVHDNAQLAAFIRRYSFCTLVTPDSPGLAVSHLPLLLDTDSEPWVLRGHFAKANDHWQVIDKHRSTAVFHGPHSYISPAWYENSSEVPTWNYAVVHARGRGRLVESPERLSNLVDDMIAEYETRHGSPWNRELPADYRERQLRHIVGFEIVVERLQGKYKLGQNRSAADQRSMQAALAESNDPEGRALASFMAGLPKD